tara:strand:+ start:119 stop:295 length:177 start_codon:yes stop_codon:yes gene_type:complete
MKYVNRQNTKDQVERFGMIVRDDDFYKNAEATLQQFLIEEEVSDEEKVEDKADEVTDE